MTSQHRSTRDGITKVAKMAETILERL